MGPGLRRGDNRVLDEIASPKAFDIEAEMGTASRMMSIRNNQQTSCLRENDRKIILSD
jgi:hypothetical protein